MSNHSECAFPDDFLGSTGRFPQGRLTPQDEGELMFAVGHKNGKVVVDFGKPVSWIGFEPEQAIQLAEILRTSALNVIAGKHE